jgi:hypothetical protein
MAARWELSLGVSGGAVGNASGTCQKLKRTCISMVRPPRTSWASPNVGSLMVASILDKFKLLNRL